MRSTHTKLGVRESAPPHIRRMAFPRRWSPASGTRTSKAFIRVVPFSGLLAVLLLLAVAGASIAACIAVAAPLTTETAANVAVGAVAAALAAVPHLKAFRGHDVYTRRATCRSKYSNSY